MTDKDISRMLKEDLLWYFENNAILFHLCGTSESLKEKAAFRDAILERMSDDT